MDRRRIFPLLFVGIIAMALSGWIILLSDQAETEIMVQLKQSADYDGDVPWILIFSYIRGGSSFLGSIFSMHPRAFYWYEPLSDVYNAMMASALMTFPTHVVYTPEGKPRRISQKERRFIQANLGHLLSCQFEELPLEMLISWTMSESPSAQQYRHCMPHQKSYWPPQVDCQKDLSSYCTQFSDVAMSRGCIEYMNFTRIRLETDINYKVSKSSNIIFKPLAGGEKVPSPSEYMNCLKVFQEESRQCIGQLDIVCKKALFKAAKVVRTRMDVIEDILRIHPNTFVIHQLRDPRGTIVSRWKGKRLFSDQPLQKGAKNNPDLVLEAKLLCGKILDDLKARKELEQKYPGRFLQVKYENLADNPQKALEQIYSYVGLTVPSEVYDWVERSTNANRDEGPFSEKRANSSKTAHAWEDSLNQDTRTKIDEICAEVYAEAGYQ